MGNFFSIAMEPSKSGSQILCETFSRCKITFFQASRPIRVQINFPHFLSTLYAAVLGRIAPSPALPHIDHQQNSTTSSIFNVQPHRRSFPKDHRQFKDGSGKCTSKRLYSPSKRTCNLLQHQRSISTRSSSSRYAHTIAHPLYHLLPITD